MKFRPDTTTSERQLVMALATHGRRATLGELSIWRKDGLLPPLASSGVGNGRTYYWREPDIQAQAEAAHDALQQYGRVDMAILSLWLQGFRVPLALLRRAWLHRCKQRTPFRVRSGATGQVTTDVAGFVSGLSGLLLQTLICTGAAMDIRDSPPEIVPLLERALVKLGYARSGDNTAMAANLWQVMMVMTSVLEGSDLVREVTDQEMWESQRYLRAAVRLLEDCGEPEDGADIVASVAPSLFILILALLHSGRGAVLESAALRLDNPRRGTGLHTPIYAQA